MSFTDELEIHYPITVLQRQFSSNSELNQELYNNILQLEKAAEHNNNNAVDSGKITTQGGFQTPLQFNFFQQNHAAVETFKNDCILPAVKEYLQQVFKDSADNIQPWLVGWANILRESNWQRPHFHPTEKNLISGVYYVKLPKNTKPPEGCIEFINPMPISINHGFSNTRRIQPSEGKLILFPPYYMHYVHPFTVAEDRAVIAFDVLSQAPGLQLVF